MEDKKKTKTGQNRNLGYVHQLFVIILSLNDTEVQLCSPENDEGGVFFLSEYVQQHLFFFPVHPHP